ncbi:MAG: Ig-like domain repeat protein [Acidobacteriota bacterium]|nr:Ig-like domain repeat protein [Acidobacteriota bacterium]
MRSKRLTMGFRATVMVGLGLLPLVASIGVQTAAHAAGTAPAWEPDPSSASYGQVVFYDANGNVVTSGSDYNNPFAWAVGATPSDTGVNTGNLITALPQKGVLTALWPVNSDNSSPLPPTGAPADVTALAATNTVVAGGTAASLLNFNVKYPTTADPGYQDVAQFRVTDSGTRGAGNATHGTYWSADVAFNPTTAPITVLGVTIPPSGWAQVFPVVTPTSTTGLTTSATSGNLNIGQSITLTANVTPAGGATGAGSVNFFDDTGSGPTLLGSGAVNSSGVATYNYTPGGGNQSYTATFVPTLGDIQNPNTATATMTGESTSSAVAVSVTAPATTTTVTSSGNNSVVGTAVTYTATIGSSGGTPNGGTVVFNDGGSPITNCGSQAVSAGVATCNTTPTTAGGHNITAVYSPGTAPFAGSTSATFVQTVAQGTTTTNLSASPNPGGDSQNVTLTATVAVATGAGTPTGTVKFENNGTAITSPNDCSAVPLTSLAVTCITTFASGTYNLSAAYSGDSNFSPSTGTTSEPVYPGTTTTVSSSSTANTSVVGESVTYTATVASTTTPNAGTVSFTDGGSPIAGCSAATVTSGVATCQTTPAGLGSHSIVATYTPGTAPFGGSTSSPFTQTVNQASTRTTLGSLTPAVTGQAVTFSAQVAVTAPGGGTPTGTVTFEGGTTTLCTSNLNTSGTASCTYSSLLAVNSPYTITAAYGGDTNFAASTSSPAPQAVTPASTSLQLTLGSGTNPSYTGQTIQYQAVLSVSTPGAGTPTGAVVFQDGGTTLCTVALGSSLTVGCNETPVTAGPHSITASYAGDPNFLSATKALTQTVQNPTAPGAPTGAAATPGDTKVSLSWTAPSSNGGSTILGYNVYVGTSAGGESATPANSALITGTTYTVTGLTNAKKYYFTVEAVNAVGLSAPSTEVSATPVNSAGYLIVGRDGGVFSFGGANYQGSLGGVRLSQPIVAVASTPDKGGYWMVAADGGVFTFGDAGFYGSLGNVHLVQPIIALIPTHDGKGYWLVARDGGIFTFGDATFHGSLGNVHLAQPIVGAAPTSDGGGYWMVAADGGIFTFGDATYHGSLGNVHLAQPIVAMVATSDGGGYWLVAADGGVFSFGDALYRGSVPGTGASVTNVIGAA